METDSRSLVGLGIVINIVVILGFVVLAVAAFQRSTEQLTGSVVVAPAETVAARVVSAESPAPQPTAIVTAAAPASEPTMAPATAPTTQAAASPTVAAGPAITSTGETTAAPAVAAGEIDPAVVAAIVTKGTCNACHTIPGVAGAVGIVGPNLANIGNEAASRIPGYSAEQYIHESIVSPNAFVAPKCPFGACVPGSMPTTLAQTLTEEEITTMVNYLLTLKSAPQ